MVAPFGVGRAHHAAWRYTVRAFFVLLRVPPCWGPGGSFNRLGYMDDTTGA